MTIDEQLAALRETAQLLATTGEDVQAKGQAVSAVATDLIAKLDVLKASIPPAASPPPPPPPPSVRTAEVIRAIISAEVAKVTPRSLTNSEMAAWVAHFAALEDLDDSAFLAAVVAMVAKDRIQYGWPPLTGTPAPTPSPPPPPPPSEGDRWTEAMVERAIESSTGLNEAGIAFLEGGNGWKRGGSVAFGSEWRMRGMPSWAPRSSIHPESMYWPFFYFWGVLFQQTDSQEIGWVEVKDLDWQIRYKNGQFLRIAPKSQQVGWGEIFNKELTESTGAKTATRAGTEGGTSIQMVAKGSPHFAADNGGTFVPSVENIEAVIASVTHRIDPRTPNVRALIDVGGDPKPTTGGQWADGVPWYPGFAVSRAEIVTKDWRTTVASNVLGGIDQPAGRCITQQSLRERPPLR